MRFGRKNGTVAAAVEVIAFYNSFRAEATFVLARKRTLTGEKVKDCVEELKGEAKLQPFRLL